MSTVRSVVEEALTGAHRLQEELGAFATLEDSWALERADQLDRSSARDSERGPLFGLPVAIKANMCLEGWRMHCGSRILEHYRAPYTATFVQRLLDAGAVPIGTTSMDEFAMGSSGENSAFELAKNPWDTERTPGGSSAGSAAAVAAGIVPLALGSDTGGSVRQPAALCGIAGFKPSYGRVSRYGLAAFGSSLDQVSPFAREVQLIEACMEAIGGPDPMDATSAPDGAFRSDTQSKLAGLRIGVPREYMTGDLDAGVRAVVEGALDRLTELGCQLSEVSLPHTDVGIATYYVLATAEASSNLARYDGVRYGLRAQGDGSLGGMISATRVAGFGDEVRRRILLGTFVLSSGYYEAWYGRAQRARALVMRDFERAFEGVDLVAGPTSPTPAFRLGERTEDPLAMYLSDVLTVPVSLAGLPAVSVPAGFVMEEAQRLPVGLQLIGPHMADARVLALARSFVETTGLQLETPPVACTGGTA